MAASFPRPDPSSPSSVADAGFSTSRRGFNQDEVRAFLTSVAAELSRVQENERQLAAELRQARADESGDRPLDEETVAELLGEETVKVLQTARHSASEIKIRAEENAARVVQEATDEAQRLRSEAEVEVARIRKDAAADAEAEIALAKQQGREMVNEARAYRERVLADLERRTNIAQRQIEELIHGRDRLLQVFERARLVAVDVTSELQAVDSPDELVDLTPTTGPVPLMVPNAFGPSSRALPTRRDEPAQAPATDDGAADATGEDGDAAASTRGERTDAELDDDHDDVGDTAVADVEQPDAATHDVGDEAEADLEPDTADALDTAADAAEPAAGPTNVVSLFSGRSADESTDEQQDTDEVADDEMADANAEEQQDTDAQAADDAGADVEDRPDVGGIFARLRDAVSDDHDTASSETASPDDPDTASSETASPDDPDDAVESAEAPTGPTSAFERRDEELVPLILSAARKLKRVLADEQNGVLDTLRNDPPVTSLDEIVPELSEHVSPYLEAIEEELLAAALVGAAELDGREPGSAGSRETDVDDALATAHRLMRTDLIQPLRDRLDRAVNDGGGDNHDVTRRVRAVYREWKTQHIDDLLDDVLRFAHGGGLVAAAGDIELVWSVDPSGPACPDCEDNSLAGPVRAGRPFPTGHVAAPAHPGCRCLTLPTSR
jgi:DivIVA domain-containing protein